jgi:hypothetical protein
LRLLHLETEGVRALRDGVGHAISTAPVVVVTGPQSCGLSTFLGAIAWSAASLGVGELAPSAMDVVRAGGTAATIRTRWALDDDERAQGGTTADELDAEVVYNTGKLDRADADPALLGAMSRYDHTPERSKVVLIPARRVTDAGFPAFFDVEVDQRKKRFSEAEDKYASIPAAVSRLALEGQRARFDPIRETFGKLCDSARLVGANRSMQPEFDLPSGLRVTLPRLGYAERNAFVLAALPTLLGLDRSIVLLDTPEMGLAPGRARGWVEALSGTTPRGQWIVATRDPELVASVPAAARITLEAPFAARRLVSA